jgi:hypothetical protein
VVREESWELTARLERLEAEEREVSAQRAKLHDRLASFSNAETERHERELSERRKELHDEIDRLKTERDAMGKASS